MQVKGVSVKSIPEFVKKNYPAGYQEWLNSLPEDSRNIFKDFIKINEWYPIKQGLTIPIRAVGTIFFNGDWKKAVWTMGRYSASVALSGVYKIYVKLGSSKHLIDRAGRVVAAYFTNCNIKVAESTQKGLVLQILRFDEPDEAIEYNIAGWIERALEISGQKNVKIEIPKSLARKDAITEFVINWE